VSDNEASGTGGSWWDVTPLTLSSLTIWDIDAKIGSHVGNMEMIKKRVACTTYGEKE
jgi:hypothetical protein